VPRIVLALLLVAVTVFVLVRLVNWAASAQPKQLRTPGLPELGPSDIEEPAALADGPDRGYGVLRLTPSQLIFAANSGRVLTVERLEITGATTTRELPGQETAKPVLAVASGERVYYFAVNDPLAWELRLL